MEKRQNVSQGYCKALKTLEEGVISKRKKPRHKDPVPCLAEVQCWPPISVQEVPPSVEAPKIAEGQRFSVVQETLGVMLPSLSFLVDGGCSTHVAVTDPSKFTSLQSCRVVVATAKQCEDKRVKCPDAVQVINLNIQDDPEMLNIREALNIPVVQRDIKSCGAQLKNQVILPTPSAENLFQGNNQSTLILASAAISVYQVGSLCSSEAYEALEHYAGNDPKATRKFPSTAKKRSRILKGRR
jgi:hypothetical protein